MTEEAILEQLWHREQDAVSSLEQTYGKRSLALALRILKNREDAEECVNEAYLRLWDSIPPARPRSLWAYLSRTVRNLALDRLRELGSLRRGGSAVTVALDELTQVCGAEDVEDRVSANELGRAVQAFLRTQPPMVGAMFIRRYFYFEDRSEIAARYGVSTGQVSVTLSRTRKKLAAYLKEEGFL